MSYTYKIVYELTERLTEAQLNVMQSLLDKPWTPPAGYSGQVIKARMSRYICDSDECRTCELCTPDGDDLPEAHVCVGDCVQDHYGLEP